MLKNNILIAWRSLLRNKLQTSINILGLAIGIAGCLTVFLLAKYELSFNKDIVDGDRIYRVYTKYNGQFSGVNPGVPTGAIALSPTVLQDAEIICPLHTFTSNIKVPNENNQDISKKFKKQEDLVFTHPNYFDLIQNYEWVTGSPRASLSKPNQVVLTEKKVKLYFGLQNTFEAVGREIIYLDSVRMTVSGVLKNPDFQSDFYFNEFLSAATITGSSLEEQFEPNLWNSTSSSNQLFVKSIEGTSSKTLSQQLTPLNKRLNETKDEVEAKNEFKLQPLSDLHFNADIGIFDSSRSPASKSTLKGLMLLAALLLLIAAVNFINLATVQATRRAKETGVRKIIGASRTQLSYQFLTETALIAVLALPVAIVLSDLSLRYFSEFLPPELAINVGSPENLLFLVITVFVVTFLAGLYPSFVQSSFQPAFALKQSGGNFLSKQSSGLRKGLIVFQFVLAQAFIIGALIMGQQLNYVLHKDLGFDKDAVVYFYTPWGAEASKRLIFQQKLEQLPVVKATALQNKSPLERGYQTTVIEIEKNGEKQKKEVHARNVDTAYINMYGIQLLAGRNFHPSDTIKEFIVNESFAREMGYDEPREAIGHLLPWRKQKLAVVGVVKDFHVRSFHHEIPFVAITCTQKGNYAVAAKISQAEPLAVNLKKMEGIWKEVYPNADFDYNLLNETIENLYKTETQTAKLIYTATGLAILISCLGLFGLAFFTVTHRAKEISIRKVLGATVGSIVGLISKDFLKLVVMALLIASPLAYYFMSAWLSEFAYRVDIHWWIFLVAGVLAVAISFSMVGYQSMKAALANPVDSLKNE